MIDWDSPTWGGGVTLADNGSWVTDRADDSEDPKASERPSSRHTFTDATVAIGMPQTLARS